MPQFTIARDASQFLTFLKQIIVHEGKVFSMPSITFFANNFFHQICAGFGGSSTVSGCMGDSGGPFVCRDKSSQRWVLHGAVSWGSRTCSAGHNEFTVFARVSEFVNWIKQHVGNVQPPPGPQTPAPPTPPPPGGSSGNNNNKSLYKLNTLL